MEESVIMICQGPPRCDLEGETAYEAQVAGCQWCQRLYIDGDGNERVTEPTSQ